MKLYNVRIKVLLEQVGFPDVVVYCNGETKELILTEPTWVQFNFQSEAKSCQLIVEHRNRKLNDGITAIIVNSVVMNDITSDKITYEGIYTPNQMLPRQTTYVDHNGKWVLDFTVPVYTWLHKIQGMGWIYD